MADITDITADVLTSAAGIKRAWGTPSDAEIYHRLGHEARELLDCMGARWPDHRERLTRIAAMAVVALFADTGEN